jgi:hypothetical protein
MCLLHLCNFVVLLLHLLLDPHGLLLVEPQHLGKVEVQLACFAGILFSGSFEHAGGSSSACAPESRLWVTSSLDSAVTLEGGTEALYQVAGLRLILGGYYVLESALELPIVHIMAGRHPLRMGISLELLAKLHHVASWR